MFAKLGLIPRAPSPGLSLYQAEALRPPWPAASVPETTKRRSTTCAGPQPAAPTLVATALPAAGRASPDGLLRQRLGTRPSVQDAIRLLPAEPFKGAWERTTELDLGPGQQLDAMQTELFCRLLAGRCPALEVLRLPALPFTPSAVGYLASLTHLRSLHLRAAGRDEASHQVFNPAFLPQLQEFSWR